jgi:hypothetical protein
VTKLVTAQASERRRASFEHSHRSSSARRPSGVGTAPGDAQARARGFISPHAAIVTSAYGVSVGNAGVNQGVAEHERAPATSSSRRGDRARAAAVHTGAGIGGPAAGLTAPWLTAACRASASAGARLRFAAGDARGDREQRHHHRSPARSRATHPLIISCFRGLHKIGWRLT